MTQHEHRTDGSHLSKWMEEGAPFESNREIVELAAERARATEEAGAAIARQFNGPMTALLLYMNEIKQHSHQFAHSPAARVYLQQVVENALHQTERVCAMLKQISDIQPGSAPVIDQKTGWDNPPARIKDESRPPKTTVASKAGQKPLTRREREVLRLISEGYSNKQGALRMNISPRTFESHRAEAMRKLGARNTADLVRKALMQSA
ncbi:helix-turn-helix transcriptional regulator [Bradyrhizobium sp. BRP22]|uniref:helix-turn-helix domain-containing protein n=1 Tax=Bradyrhizobium sp. BRP22 TaxID=2793821 RepID=UPI001CD403D3|nr:helix-turn-helix transcriptional regulator [Bradyrhizobium sp. BRP22]MCA1457465.1 helix-turn-helix transcriptional regulator [Bradyrhizobium sp. BRP22]